jgi:hypothetical protein
MSMRAGRWALLAGLLLHLLFVVSLKTQWLTPLFIEARHAYGQAGDYFGIYQAGDNLVHGWSIYDAVDYRNEAVRRVPYFYFYRYLPPTAYVSAAASLAVAPWTGYVLWVLLTELLMAAIVVAILRLDRFPIRDRRLYAGLWLGFFPFYLEQWMGQFSFLMAAFLWVIFSGGMREATRDGTRPAAETPPRGRAFWAFAASVGLKSFTALFALPYLRRRWIRPVILCAAAVALACAPYYIARPADLKQFLLLNFRPLPPGIHGGTLGASAFVRALGWLLPESIAGIRLDLRFFDVYMGNVPVFAMIVAVLALSAWATWRHGARAPINTLLAVWMLAFFLIFKDVWEYHYVMLLPVVTALGLSTGSPLVLWMTVLLAVPTPYLLFADPTATGGLPQGANLLHHAAKALPTAVLFVWTLRRAATTAWAYPRASSSPAASAAAAPSSRS